MPEYHLPEVSAENVMGVARIAATMDARAPGRTLDRSTVERSLNLSKELARRALLAAEQLEFIRAEGSQGYVYAGDQEIRHAKKTDLAPFMGKQLLTYPPFLIFVTELAREYPAEEAASFTVGVLDVQCKPDLALKVLRGWGIYSGLLEIRDGNLIPTFEPIKLLDFGFLKRLAEAMESDAKIRMFVVDELGAELVADMSKRGLGHLPVALADALSKHESDPRRIGDPVGSMIEAYCVDLMATTVSTNSLPDIARKLEDQGVILTPHRNLLYGMAGIRHPASHGPDKTTGRPWTITSRGSLIGQLLALVTLRSIHLWVSSGRQEI